MFKRTGTISITNHCHLCLLQVRLAGHGGVRLATASPGAGAGRRDRGDRGEPAGLPAGGAGGAMPAGSSAIGSPHRPARKSSSASPGGPPRTLEPGAARWALRAAVDALLHQGRQHRDVALGFGPVIAVAASARARHRHEPAVDLRLDELAAGREVSGDDRHPAGQRLRDWSVLPVVGAGNRNRCCSEPSRPLHAGVPAAGGSSRR